jgi:hypothetical protein
MKAILTRGISKTYAFHMADNGQANQRRSHETVGDPIAQKSTPALHRLYEDAIEANDWKAARTLADTLQRRTGIDPTTRIADLFEEAHFPSFMVSMLTSSERQLVLGLLKLFRTPENKVDLRKARALLSSRGQLSRAEIRAQVRKNRKQTT